MTAVLLPQGKQQYFTAAGIPLVGGKVFTWDAGTTNPRPTWADAAQVGLNTNPVILDARGEASIFWAGAYKVQLQDSLGNIIWTQDGVASQTSVSSDNYSVDSGVANAYVVAAAIAVPALTAGLRVAMKAINTNTGASTLNYMALGAKNIVLPNGSALTGGEIISGSIYQLEYDGANFQILNQSTPFMARTPAEATAAVVPINYSKWPSPWKDISRFVNDNTGATNVAAGMQNAFAAERAVIIPDGTYRLDAAVTLRSGMRIEGTSPSGAIFKAGGAAAALLSAPAGNYNNIHIAHLALDGNAIAAKCLEIIGAAQGSVSQIILFDVVVGGATQKPLHMVFGTYFDILDCVISGGQNPLYLDRCFDGSVNGSTIYNGTVNAVALLSCSQMALNQARIFNNPGVVGTSLLMLDSCYGCSVVDATFEPQGAACVTYEVELKDTAAAGNCTANRFSRCNFIGQPATKTASMGIGTTNAVFATVVEDCRFIKPAAGSSILALLQQDTSVSRSCDLVTYDTTPYAPVTITNTSGNTVYQQNQTGVFQDIQALGRIFAKGQTYFGTPALAIQTGTSTYAGAGVPLNANGANGDYYWRSDTPGTAGQRLYVKSAGVWVATAV